MLIKIPPKHCDLDPVPTWLVKKAAVVQLLYYVKCAMQRHAVASHKRAIVRSLLKKPKLELGDHNLYRPISNLTFTYKLVERVVAARFMKHVDDHTLLPAHQSAYRRFHSTETAIAAVHNYHIRAADADQVTALVLLDVSSAFDTVDHNILMSVLETRFGVKGVSLRWFQSYLLYLLPHRWFQSYLLGRTQYVRRGLLKSSIVRLTCGVPQG